MLKKLFLCLLAAILLVGGFSAGIAYAQISRIDDAADSVTKAIALLQAAENPGVVPPWGGHRKKALRHLNLAQQEIAACRAWFEDHLPE
jgi:hypothetical protein